MRWANRQIYKIRYWAHLSVWWTKWFLITRTLQPKTFPSRSFWRRKFHIIWKDEIRYSHKSRGLWRCWRPSWKWKSIRKNKNWELNKKERRRVRASVNADNVKRHNNLQPVKAARNSWNWKMFTHAAKRSTHHPLHQSVRGQFQQCRLVWWHRRPIYGRSQPQNQEEKSWAWRNPLREDITVRWRNMKIWKIRSKSRIWITKNQRMSHCSLLFQCAKLKSSAA